MSNKLHNTWCEVDCLMSLSNVSAMKFKENSANNSSIAGIFFALSVWGFEHLKILITGQLSLKVLRPPRGFRGKGNMFI